MDSAGCARALDPDSIAAMSVGDRLRGLAIGTIGALACLPSVALAGGGNGLLVSNIDYNCSSLTTGNPYFEPMISAVAGWGSEGEAPVVGRPFTAQFSVGMVGHSCSGSEISPTVIPPVGVRVAIDASHPLQWRYPDDSGAGAWNTAGIRPLPLADGTTKLLADDGQGHTLWPIVNDRPPLQFLVPLVADRELTGAGSGPDQCPNGPPCAASEAGDYLQVKVDASIGTPRVLAPVVALYATPAPAGEPTTPGAPGTPGTPGAPLHAITPAKLPTSVRAATLRRGWTIKLSAAKGAKVVATISTGNGKRRKTLARGSATARSAGALTLKLTPTAAGRAVLRTLHRTATATLRLTASGTGLTSVTRSGTLRIRG
jgi:hypothetical protein